MEDILPKVTLYLDKLRDAITWVAEKISGAFDLDVSNVNLVLILLFSYFLGQFIFKRFYTTTEGRTGAFLFIIGIIFIIIKYL